MVSASFTMSSVICVTSTTLDGIGFSGLTKHSNSSMTSPFLIFIIPTSVIFSVIGEKPVVSKSSTQYSVSISCPLSFLTERSLSLTKYASTPYKTFKSAPVLFKNLWASGKDCTTPWSVIAMDFQPQSMARFSKSVHDVTASIWLILVCM